MNWLDRPISAQTSALLSCVGIGIAAFMLGRHVGMSTLEAFGFAVILATSVGGLVDYAANAHKRND